MDKNAVFTSQVKPFTLGIGQYLLKDQLIALTKLEEAENYCQSNQIALTHYLVQSKQLTSSDLLKCCLRNFELPFFDITHMNLEILTANIFPIDWVKHFRIIPIAQYESCLHLGVTDPSCFPIITKVRFHIGLPVKLFLVDEDALEKLLTDFLNSKSLITLDSLINEVEANYVHENKSAFSIEKEEDEPIANLVNQLFSNAEKANASDIHCEPYYGRYRIRFRIDGLLNDQATIPLELANRILARIKLLGNLDVTEKRHPQDGRMRTSYHSSFEIRISTCPTIEGEKIALRLFRQKHEQFTLESLGILLDQLDLVSQAINRPYGLIIVTGPTGSGKTATLYAILNTLKSVTKNIITIEDPVEMIIPGINQIPVNNKIGLSFSVVLRTILRQDPDVIMIGEIRDAETAAIALQAASTGHLVLGTLHANHSLAAINRLVLLGVSIQDCLQNLILCMTQRLLRKLCSHCKVMLTDLHDMVVYKSSECHQCNNGYMGRVGVFEIFNPDYTNINLFNEGYSLFEIKNILLEEGWLSLKKAALKKIFQGVTSFEEVERVIGYV